MEWIQLLETAQLGTNGLLLGAIYLLYRRLERTEQRNEEILAAKDKAMHETIAILRDLARSNGLAPPDE